MTGLRVLVWLALTATLLGIGCSDSESPQDAPLTATSAPVLEPTAAPAPEATPSALQTPDGNRILEDVRHLSETIGPRAAGTAREKEAAEFVAERLRGHGYEVSFQEFSLGRDIARSSSLGVVSPQPRTISTVPFGNSGNGTVRLPMVAAGIGRQQDFPADTAGKIALIARDGVIFFTEKVRNAQAAGAAGVVIYNNEPGIFAGTLEEPATIPVVSISQAEGQALAAGIQAGPVEADLVVGSLSDAVSYNVIAKPPSGVCDTISGGHYDSVQQAPGASDNATGTATVMEIASLLAKNGNMGNHCFVLFGAEELGLIGSRAYVNSLDSAARARIKAMLNFDMVGVGDETWLLIGTPSLQQRATRIVDELDITAELGALPPVTSSDHASFINAGIPSLMFHRTEDPLLHTPQDVVGRVKPELLEQAARMGIAFLESLDAGG